MKILALALAQKTVPLLNRDVFVPVPYPRMPVMSVVLVIGHVTMNIQVLIMCVV